MARIRSIKPEIVSDQKLFSLGPDVFRTFVHAISQADDCGLLPGSPRTVIALLYPLLPEVPEKQARQWIQRLIDAGMLEVLSSLDGAPLLHVTTWDEHQKVEKPHLSALSRSLLTGPVSNNSMMTREQRDAVVRTIRERIADERAKHSRNASPKDSGKDSGNRSGNNSRQDLGPWTLDHGKNNSSVCVEVLHHTPRDRAPRPDTHTQRGAA